MTSQRGNAFASSERNAADEFEASKSNAIAAPHLSSLAAALLAHGLLAAALLLWPRTPPTLAGISSVRINLVSSAPGATPATGMSTSPSLTGETTLADLARGLSDGANVAPAAQSPTSPGATRLSDLLGETAAGAPQGQAATTRQAHSGAAAGAGGDKLDLDPFGHAALSYADGKPTEPVQLWPEVAACWKTSPGAPPVIVRVTLDELGRLAGAPKPLRPALARLSAERAEAESSALAAIKSCAPYPLTPGRRPGRSYDLDFR